MPIAVYQYKFSRNADAFSKRKASRDTYQALFRELRARELLFLCHRGYGELFVIPEKLPDESSVRDILQSHQLLPEASPVDCRLLIGRDAVTRFLHISVGAAGSHGGVKLMELLYSEFNRISELELSGPVLNHLFQRGIWLHEKVRQETRFFQFAVAPAAVIDELSKKILGKQKKFHLAVIGHSPSLSHLVEEMYQFGHRRMTFMGNKAEIDRDAVLKYEGAIRMASGLAELPHDADLLLVFPSETHKLSDALLKKRMRQRSGALLVFDFGGNILNIRKLNRIADLYIYSGTDIEKVIRYNEAQREDAAGEVEKWVEREIDAFYQWYNSEDRYQFAGIIGTTPRMQRIFEMISRISQTDITVLIDGESGTGKELVAKAIHKLSSRAEKPFMVINCGAIPEHLLESELFGHVRGAFTGAIAQKQGLFEAANTGTLFLDEIGELPQHLQVKLLRALQEGEIKRVGSNETIQIDVRVLAATNKNLAEMVGAQTFRSDLYYRLKVIQLTTPPLRERVPDIPLLAKHFVKKFSKKLRKDVTGITPEALEILKAYHWPGNVRELENAIEHAIALAIGSNISGQDLPKNLQNPPTTTVENGKFSGQRLTLKALEKRYILETLNACEWNYEKVCNILAIGRTTLWRKIREYALDEGRDSEKL